MLVGFWTTFLIQHSAGLSGMPRRVYEYPDVGHLELYNLISTIGSFILALGILADGRQRRAPACARRRRRARTRGAATRSSGSRTSPPPVNNFDVVPRVRSVEPMKDIRRQIERQTRTPVRARGRAGACSRRGALRHRDDAHRVTARAGCAAARAASCSPTTSR